MCPVAKIDGKKKQKRAKEQFENLSFHKFTVKSQVAASTLWGTRRAPKDGEREAHSPFGCLFQKTTSYVPSFSLAKCDQLKVVA